MRLLGISLIVVNFVNLFYKCKMEEPLSKYLSMLNIIYNVNI